MIGQIPSCFLDLEWLADREVFQHAEVGVAGRAADQVAPGVAVDATRDIVRRYKRIRVEEFRHHVGAAGVVAHGVLHRDSVLQHGVQVAKRAVESDVVPRKRAGGPNRSAPARPSG